MVKLWLDGVFSRPPHGRIDDMFGPVVTIEAHLAFSGARIQSNNTAEMTAMFEALSFLGSRGPVNPDEQSRICYDSMHAAGICLCTIQARTHVQLALACQQSMIRVQHRLRLIMHHVFGHGGNWVMNALIMLLLLAHVDSSLAIMSPRAGFITTSTLLYVFDGCINIGGVLERLQHIRTNATSLPQDLSQSCFHHRFHCLFCISRDLRPFVSFALSLFHLGSCCSQSSDGTDFFHPRQPYRVLTTTSSTTCGILY